MVKLKAFLLEDCPFSIALDNILYPYRDLVDTVWVVRHDVHYELYKHQYDHPTYPIVILEWDNHDVVKVGGYTEFINYLLPSEK